MKDKLFHFFIYEFLYFISQNEIVKFKKFVIFLFEKMIKFPKSNNLENL